MLRVVIPGEPVAQGRPRGCVINGHVRMYDPKKSRTWKAGAQDFFRQAMAGTPMFEGPVSVEVVAVFTCPKGDHRKRTPVPQRPHAKRPDAENVAKAVLDAATGIVWQDDAQVSDLRVRKFIGAQGEAPGVRVYVYIPISGSEDL